MSIRDEHRVVRLEKVAITVDEGERVFRADGDGNGIGEGEGVCWND